MMMLAVLLPMLFFLSTYAINLAYIEAMNADVQVVTDVAVQAVGRAYIQTEDRAAALAAAQEAAQRNPVAGVVLPIQMADLDFGISRRSSMSGGYDFTQIGDTEFGNSVRLVTRSLQNSNTPVLKPVFPTMGANISIRPDRVAVSTQSTMDVALVIDRSGSMAFASDEPASIAMPATAPPGWQFGDPVPPQARWLDLVAAVDGFTDYLVDSPQYEKVSLSTYSDASSTEAQLTYDYQNIQNGLFSISASFDGGSTAIGTGLREGLAALTDPAVSRSHAVRVMVLLTDGIHNTGVSPENAAKNLQADGVTLFTITFSDFAPQQRMADLAASCGGQHFHATDGAQLFTAFGEIARRLPSLMTQ